MSRRQSDTLSMGVLLIIVAVALVALYTQAISWTQVIALIIALYGLWTIALAGVRSRTPEKYGRSAYSTMVMGVVLAVIGGLWFLYTEAPGSIILIIALLLVIIGILAVVSALPSMRKKQQTS